MRSEQDTLNIINEKYGIKLKLSTDTFSDYDAEDSNYICEIKCRDKYYSDKYIELVKFAKNIRHSRLINKAFIYVVDDPKGIYIFNITKNLYKIIKQDIIDKPNMPVTTDFKNKKKINKLVFSLTESTATKINLWVKKLDQD